SYEVYKRMVEVGVMVGENASKTPMAFRAFSTLVGDKISGFFATIEEGDLEKIEFELGRVLGANPDVLFEPLVIGMGYARMARVLQNEVASDVLAAAKIQAKARLRKSVSERIKAARANPNVTDVATAFLAGDRISRRNLLEVFGVDSEQLKAIQKMARENGVIIAFRSRNPIARDLIKDGKAWPKPQNLKFKTVSEIDIEYLGYPENARALVDIVEPPSSLVHKSGKELNKALDAYMDLLKGKKPTLKDNDMLAAEVRQRIKTRVEEWNELVPDMNLKPDGDSTTQIVTNFEPELQVAPLKAQDKISDIGPREKRTVATTKANSIVDPVTGRERRRWSLTMSDANGNNPLPVSGDIDFMAILEPNGAMIRDPDKQMKIY
ncbi:MAG TPA: hypothetical protein VJ952_08160, partial [Opitutales bacterium]|nr:hypothetical protein [Opitutales bacterium]